MLSKIFKLILKIYIIMCLVIIVYVVINSGSASNFFESYHGLEKGTKSGIPKNLEFLVSYTMSTGDLTLMEKAGFTEEQAKAVYEGRTSAEDLIGSSDNQSDGSGPAPSPNVTVGNLAEVASIVASTFTITPNGTDYDYSQTGGGSKPYSYQGRSHTTGHRDCSCLVSGILHASGINSNWVHYDSRTIGNGGAGSDITSSINTLADLKPGHILWRSGHVAIVVSVENGTCYIADAGTTDGIKKTAENGYRYAYETTKTLGEINFTKVFCP